MFGNEAKQSPATIPCVSANYNILIFEKSKGPLLAVVKTEDESRKLTSSWPWSRKKQSPGQANSN